MRQAIITKFLCPTNVRGSRYKATCQAGSITVSADDALDVEGNHIAACAALCRKLEDSNAAKYGPGARNVWSGPKLAGETKDRTFAHVFLEKTTRNDPPTAGEVWAALPNSVRHTLVDVALVDSPECADDNDNWTAERITRTPWNLLTDAIREAIAEQLSWRTA